MTDDEALQAFHDLCHYEGIIPALESATRWPTRRRSRRRCRRTRILLVNLSGRGDKDMHTVAERMRAQALPCRASPGRFERARKAAGRKALIPFVTAGDPRPARTVPLMHALVEAGADIIELGVPFSDPMADGPVIQRSRERALKHGVGFGPCAAHGARIPASDDSRRRSC